MDKQQRYELYKYAVGPGWWPVLDKYIPKILEADPDAYLYCKEKYGLLRIEISSKKIAIEQHMALENAAEMESSFFCECCGRPGRHRPDLDWMLTLCDECYKGGEKVQAAAEEEAEKRWLESDAAEYMENYEKQSAPRRWDLTEHGIPFEIDEEMHQLIDEMLDAFVSAQPTISVPAWHIGRAIAERLADGRLTNDQAGLLYKKFVREASEWVC